MSLLVERRDFFKILTVSSAAAVTTACGDPTDTLIPLLIPDQDLAPGEESWHPAVCGECSAGCGTVVRVMRGTRVIEQTSADGKSKEKVRQRLAAIKKIEGNPLDPVSGGRLCARGQAVVQALYHPDRLQGPMKRTGQRGEAKFAPISWKDAMEEAKAAVAKAGTSVVALTGPQIGTRSLSLQKFLKAVGASEAVVCTVADHPVERKAAERVFGWKGLPLFDLANATSAIGVGADFLGGWASPVYYARQFGAFRQGRRGLRGHLVQAESRFSITAGAADRWLPLKPGTELQFLLALGAMLVDSAGSKALPKPVLEAFRTADVKALLEACGLEERRVRPLVAEFAKSERPLVLPGASTVHSNSVDAVAAGYYLNVLLGNVDKAGGMLAPVSTAEAESRPVMEALAGAKAILVEGANPAYTLPTSAGAMKAFAAAETVISFSAFLDDTAAWADLILPASHYLEAETALAPPVSPRPGFSIGVPFIRTLHDTKPFEQILGQLADFTPVTAKDLAGEAWDTAQKDGGAWHDAPAHKAAVITGSVELRTAEFAGDAAKFPLLFQPYLSLQFHDGSGANLPWMQELPDPASSTMWGLPVEIDPKTASALGIHNGDRVKVQSAEGSLEAQAYVHPAAVPGVVSMGIGGGHTHYTRYAAGRGANPLSILAAVWEKSTSALATGATRVQLSRLAEGQLIQYSDRDREEKANTER